MKFPLGTACGGWRFAAVSVFPGAFELEFEEAAPLVPGLPPSPSLSSWHSWLWLLLKASALIFWLFF